MTRYARRFSAAVAAVLLTSLAMPSGAADLPPGKNWAPPAHRIFAQQLSDQIMRDHPELISVTFHGVPPDAAPKTYTMYAGSFPERIGNVDDPDDVMVIEKGITILDPRWKKTNDAQRKYVVMTPLRDVRGENIGLLVLAYKNPADSGKGDSFYFAAGTKLRDELQARIPGAADLFKPVR